MFSRKNKTPKSKSTKGSSDYVATPSVKDATPYHRENTFTTEPESAKQTTPLATAPAFDFDLNSNEAILNAHGAALHAHNRDLVKRLTDLKDKRDELDSAIVAEEQEKLRYEEHLINLQERLKDVIEGLQKKAIVKAEVERVIIETESAYSKLVESSHSLLGLLERETLNIQKERKTEAEILV